MLISKIHSKLKNDGLKALLRLALRRAFPYRPACFKFCKPDIEGKTGLEIGGPSGLFNRNGSFPAYPLAARIDNCNFSHQTTWEGSIEEGSTFRYDQSRAPGRQYVAEASELSMIASAAYEFVLSSHVLEHVANPLKAMAEWIRVLKEDGLLVLVLPHLDGTFDHRRPVTALAHLIQDFEHQTTEHDLTHLEEILKLHDLSMDPAAGSLEDFAERSKRNFENRCLHQHVFDTHLAIEVVDHMGLQILAVDVFHPHDILVVARKLKSGQSARNDEFKADRGTPPWRSPFPSDQRKIH